MTVLKGLHLHFDAPSGAAGDMALGALLDLGVPEAAVRQELAALALGGYELVVAPCTRRGLAGTDIKVRIEKKDTHRHDHAHHHGHGHAHQHEHRRHRDIVDLLRARTAGRTQELALAIFERVATAESKLH